MKRENDFLALITLLFVVCMALIMLCSLATSRPKGATEATYGDVVAANGGLL